MPNCLLGFGANLRDAAQAIEAALASLRRVEGIELLRQSALHKTPPAGGPSGQPPYLNAAALVRTSLAPPALLKVCQEIEAELGRVRGEHWGPRTIDIDLLLYEELVIDSPNLKIPHPRMAWRRFVLAPAAEVAAEMRHPVIGWTVGQLFEHLNATPWYLAVAGPVAAGKSELARETARRCGARLLADNLDAARLAAFHENPSGHAEEIEIEFLDARVRQLDRQLPEWSVDRPTVSDYWFGQSMAFAAGMRAPAERRAAWIERWYELQAKVVRPRLIAFVGPAAANLPKQIDAGPDEEALSSERVPRIAELAEQQALENKSCYDGPVLWLDLAADREAALIELTAAVTAMR